jgi:hypothetical protein
VESPAGGLGRIRNIGGNIGQAGLESELLSCAVGVFSFSPAALRAKRPRRRRWRCLEMVGAVVGLYAHHEIPGSEIFGGRGGLARGNDMGQSHKHREYRREQPARRDG